MTPEINQRQTRRVAGGPSEILPTFAKTLHNTNLRLPRVRLGTGKHEHMPNGVRMEKQQSLSENIPTTVEKILLKIKS